jgi:hypothetical protein
MNLFLFVLLLVLLLRFPPGTNLEWDLGRAHVIWPVGWSLAATLILTVVLSLLKKN